MMYWRPLCIHVIGEVLSALIHPAGLWPEQDFQSVTRATAFQTVVCHIEVSAAGLHVLYEALQCDALREVLTANAELLVLRRKQQPR